MQSPSKHQQGGESTYEVPSCTICLQELVQDLSSLCCGHVYHLICISQHFEYRGTCPNCQKRSSLKEVRTIHFRLVPNNNRLNMQIKNVLDTLPSSEKNQVQALMKELKILTEDNQKMKQQVLSLESDNKSKAKIVDALREDVYRHKVDADKMIREIRRLTESCKELKSQLDEHLKVELKLRHECERLRTEEREFEQMKRYKSVLQQKSHEIVKYKAQLEANFTPPEGIAKAFYEMLLMKNLEVLRTKDNIRQLLERQSQKDGQISRQKAINENLRKDVKDLGEKRTGPGEKAKLKGVKDVDTIIDQNSQTFLNRSVHVTDNTVIQSTIRKPFFAHGSTTIGGFTVKKKDDKLKTAL